VKWFSLALLFLPSLTFAVGCSPINLLTQPNSPFEKIPVYDQDGLGSCYAYTAAQLADFDLIKKGAKDRSVHPIWIAMNYASKLEQEGISGGDTQYALFSLGAAGNCSYNSVSTSLAQWSKKNRVPELIMLDLIERVSSKLKVTQNDKGQLTTIDVSNAYKTSINEAPYCRQETMYWKSIIPQLKELLEINPTQIVAKQLLTNCSNPLPLDIGQPVKTSVPYPVFGAIEMRDLLETLHAPIEVSHCGKFWDDPKYVGLGKNGAPRSQVEADCEPHSTLIVGRKEVGESCQLLVRNSWGSGFSETTDRFKCFCRNKKTGSFVDECSRKSPDADQLSVEGCWVDMKDLANNTIDYTYIDAKAKFSLPSELSGSK